MTKRELKIIEAVIQLHIEKNKIKKRIDRDRLFCKVVCSFCVEKIRLDIE